MPEWMYGNCYDEKHKIMEMQLQEGIVKKKQKGLHSEIICNECEIVSQKYDNYASRVFTEKCMELRGVEEIEHPTFVIWRNIDFIKLQKFIFICILRAHLYRTKINQQLLIDKHYVKLLNMYNNDCIADDMSYPIVCLKHIDISDLKHIIFIPCIGKNNGHHFIEFAGAGYLFRVYVSSHKKPTDLSHIMLKKSGEMILAKRSVKDTTIYKSTLPFAMEAAYNYKKKLQ